MARHVLPNCLLPMLAVVGFDAAVLLSGAVVVESVFGLPGFGRELVTAVGTRDYPTIQGIALTAALFVVFVNLVVDALYALADPRVREAR
jgi:peptide/nickel transport system permease protein